MKRRIHFSLVVLALYSCVPPAGEGEGKQIVPEPENSEKEIRHFTASSISGKTTFWGCDANYGYQAIDTDTVLVRTLHEPYIWLAGSLDPTTGRAEGWVYTAMTSFGSIVTVPSSSTIEAELAKWPLPVTSYPLGQTDVPVIAHLFRNLAFEPVEWQATSSELGGLSGIAEYEPVINFYDTDCRSSGRIYIDVPGFPEFSTIKVTAETDEYGIGFSGSIEQISEKILPPAGSKCVYTPGSEDSEGGWLCPALSE